MLYTDRVSLIRSMFRKCCSISQSTWSPTVLWLSYLFEAFISSPFVKLIMPSRLLSSKLLRETTSEVYPHFNPSLSSLLSSAFFTPAKSLSWSSIVSSFS